MNARTAFVAASCKSHGFLTIQLPAFSTGVYLLLPLASRSPFCRAGAHLKPANLATLAWTRACTRTGRKARYDKKRDDEIGTTTDTHSDFRLFVTLVFPSSFFYSFPRTNRETVTFNRTSIVRPWVFICCSNYSGCFTLAKEAFDNSIICLTFSSLTLPSKVSFHFEASAIESRLLSILAEETACFSEFFLTFNYLTTGI